MNNYITKYEKVRIIGQRATQISQGAIPMVDIYGLNDAISIAEKEFKEYKIPFIVIREFPDGTIKKIPLNELKY